MSAAQFMFRELFLLTEKKKWVFKRTSIAKRILSFDKFELPVIPKLFYYDEAFWTVDLSINCTIFKEWMEVISLSASQHVIVIVRL